ncbi:unnamed protein product [Heterobilharzia americana]|nr:unnamed protein product [Heterobilharzia americana]
MLPEIMGIVAASGYIALNYYAFRPVYASLYKTIILGFGTYAIANEGRKALERRKEVRLQALEHYKTQFPQRVPEKSVPTYGEVFQSWKPLR